MKRVYYMENGRKVVVFAGLDRPECSEERAHEVVDALRRRRKPRYCFIEEAE